MRHLLIALAGLVLLLILRWTEKSGHALPTWGWVLILIPYLWAASFDDDDESIFGECAAAVANLLLALGALLAMGLGVLAIAMKGQGSLLEAFVFMLPAGVVMLLWALLRIFLRSR